SEIVVNVGGARSSKSYSLAQLFILKLITESKKKFLVVRKTLPALKISTYKLITDLLCEHNLYNPSNHNKSDRIYTHKSNYMYFTGLDDPQKIKSTEWNYIWMEEANEFSWEDFITLKTRLSAHSNDGKFNQLFLSLNPCDEGSWINQKLNSHISIPKSQIRNPKSSNGVTFFHSNYLNNPFLSKEYINSLLSLKDEDETFYKIYTLGEWAVPINIIYNNWKCFDKLESYNYDETIYGLDFGFNNPTALVQINFYDGNINIKQKIYETKLTNAELIARLGEVITNKKDCIYADSAEPQRIEEISRAGYNTHPAEKSITGGIDYVKRQKLFIHSSSTDIINEIKKYKWKEDKNGNVLDEPVKFQDHAMDAMRYALYTHCKKNYELKMAFI
ncbi:MAG: PBSX family phage terminase large subunit, partial [Ignavibacteria bacterium]